MRAEGPQVSGYVGPKIREDARGSLGIQPASRRTEQRVPRPMPVSVTRRQWVTFLRMSVRQGCPRAKLAASARGSQFGSSAAELELCGAGLFDLESRRDLVGDLAVAVIGTLQSLSLSLSLLLLLPLDLSPFISLISVFVPSMRSSSL